MPKLYLQFPIIALLLITVTLGYGQNLTKGDNETAKQFVNRFKPANSEIEDTVLECKWNDRQAIIAFYTQTFHESKKNDPDQQDYIRKIGNVFIKHGAVYDKFLIDTIDPEGGDPEIVSVFFANADHDSAKELIIIASWNERHYDVNGTLYNTLVYDDVLTSPGKTLHFMKQISDKLEGGCECDRRGEKATHAKFKTAAAIKKELLRLGYK